MISAMRCVTVSAALPSRGVGGEVGKQRRGNAVLSHPARAVRGRLGVGGWEVGRPQRRQGDAVMCRGQSLPAWGVCALPVSGGWAVGRQRRRGEAVLCPPRALPVSGGWAMGRQRRRGEAVLCPPPGAARGLSATPEYNLQVWCGENGRESLLKEWAHPDKSPEDFTRGSGSKVPWTCGECGHRWEARIANRTDVKHPKGCPKCNPPGRPATSNLQEWCAENGRADLLEEWAHPDKAPQDFTRASASKVPWTCGECGHAWEATIASRTDVKHPCGCPKCNPPGRPATSNLQEWCAENGRADLLQEWAHPDQTPQAGSYTRSLFSST